MANNLILAISLGFKLNSNLKVSVHVGRDKNFEIEIFAEYKYT